jgi:hypothetical protein
MLVRVAVLVLVSALALAMAACAETGSAMAAGVAEQAAMIAATQAAIASTQAIDQLEQASTQMSTGAQTTPPANLPKLPPIGKGTFVIVTPKLIIYQKNGVRYYIPRDQYYDDGDQSQ